MNHLTDTQWLEYENTGFLIIEQLLDKETVSKLQKRLNSIMMGEADVDYSRMLMQLDSKTGAYDNAGEQSKGFKEKTLNYRKIQDLEFDPVFLNLMRHPVFEDACRRTYGTDADVACFRAMFMNKPANRGTFLPMHQDRWSFLDRDPELTIWIALDPATRQNGCVQIVPGSHKAGLINPSHEWGFLTDEQTEEWAASDKIKFVELHAGDVVLLHNRLIHGSDRNHSSQSRRAFSICYMDAATKNLEDADSTYSVIFGEGALEL
jgi:ectoine hydroxylase-related dioxygenase (phytanoyl-CoA dioxygenase family)